VRVSSNAGCGALEQAFRIEQPAAMEATADLVDATCPDLADGFADVQVLGGTAPYTYAWSNGGTEEDLVALPGTYGLTVTDANECVFDAGSFVIGAGEAPVASASVESTTVLVDAPVFFDNTSGEMDSYYWEFGDGTNSDEEMPTHSWSEVGTYTVTLTVSNGIYSGTWTTDMSVELTSSIANAAATSGLNAITPTTSSSSPTASTMASRW
jgi:PKD repeat protein